jgi:hypothetical protein
VIGTMLRHRSLDTTAYYAMLMYERLGRAYCYGMYPGVAGRTWVSASRPAGHERRAEARYEIAMVLTLEKSWRCC